MIENRPSESDLELLALCLTQGYTETIIKYIDNNKLDNEYNLRNVIRGSVKYCILDNNNELTETAITVNNTITKVLNWYKDRV